MTIPHFTYELTIEKAFPDDGANFGSAEAWKGLIQQILDKRLSFAKVAKIKESDRYGTDPEGNRVDLSREYGWRDGFAAGSRDNSATLRSDLQQTISTGYKSCLTITADDTAEGKRVVGGWPEERVREFAENWVARAEARLRFMDEAVDSIKKLQEETGKIEGIMRAYDYPGSISNKVLHMESALLKSEQEVKRLRTINNNQTSTLCAYRDEARATQAEVEILKKSLLQARLEWHEEKIRALEANEEKLKMKGGFYAEETR